MTSLPRKRVLGATPVQIPELGFGGAALGNLYRQVCDEVAAETLNTAWEQGIRFFDTAPYYGFGLSEARLGDYLRGVERNDFVLSTKVGRLLTPVDNIDGNALRHGFRSPMPFEPIYDYSYDGVMRSFETSLQRLRLQHLDLLLLHDIGAVTHGSRHSAVFAEAMDGGQRALVELRSSGLVRAIGVGVNESEVCIQAMEHGDFDCFLLAGRYTLLEQGALDSLLPKCVAHGVSVIVGGPYNSGILATGVDGVEPVYYNYAPAPEAIIERVRRIQRLCQEFDVPLAAAALQFPLAHPAVAAVIPGLASSTDVRQALALHRHPIADAFWQALRDAELVHPQAPLPQTPDCRRK